MEIPKTIKELIECLEADLMTDMDVADNNAVTLELNQPL